MSTKGVDSLDRFIYTGLFGSCFSWHKRHNSAMLNVSPTVRVMPIEEQEIRSALLALLADARRDHSKILEEFRIERGSSRIDVAVVDEDIVGYEIKSDKDTFARFSNQIHAYNRVFDRINLVCGKTLADLACETIPSWWGIIIARRDSDGVVHLTLHRAASPNPRQDAFSLASLLWKDEAIAVLSSAEANAPKKASAHALWECMTKSLSINVIRRVVAESLLKRQSYRELAVKTI